MRYDAPEEKEKDFGTIVCCFVGAAIWWFLASQPSTVMMVIAALLVIYLFLGYCLLAILLPSPDMEPKIEAFAPIPQAEVNRPKALTL